MPNPSAMNYMVPRDILGSITCASVASDATTTVNLTKVRCLDIPTGLAVAKTGSGSTTWGYKITAVGQAGETAASAEATVASQNGTLSSSAYNTLTWYPVDGVRVYNLWRSTAGTSPNTTGLIGTVGNDITTFSDTGIALTGGATIPSADTSYLATGPGVNHITVYNTGSVDLYVFFPWGSNATIAAAVANAHLAAVVGDTAFTKRLVCKAAQWRQYDFTKSKFWICIRAASGTGSCVIEVA